MTVRFFCDGCNEEIFQNISENIKMTTTIMEIEQQCECSDCILKRLRENMTNEEINNETS